MRWHGRTPPVRNGPAADVWRIRLMRWNQWNAGTARMWRSKARNPRNLIGVRGVGLRIFGGFTAVVLITHIFTLRHYMHAAHNVNSYFDRTVGRAHQLRNDRSVERFHNSGFEFRLFLRNEFKAMRSVYCASVCSPSTVTQADSGSCPTADNQNYLIFAARYDFRLGSSLDRN